MKSPYVCELKPNQLFTSTFLVHVKDVRQKKSGDPYLSLLLGDRTGDLDAKMWDNVAEVIDTFERDDFVKVKGLLQIFQNRPQLTIHKMARVLESDVDFADYFPGLRARPDRDVRRAARDRRRRCRTRTCAGCSMRSSTTSRSRACIAPRPPPSTSITRISAGCSSTCSRSVICAAWRPRTTTTSISTCCSPALSCTTSARWPS